MEGIYIVVMIGFGTPLNLPLFRAGFEAQLRHYPRFRNIQTHDSMVECGKSNDATWGNKLGYIILPFRIAMHDDQIAYIREAKKMAERKKRSLEVIMTQKMTEIFLKCFGVKATSFIVRRMLGNTTLLFSNMIGPVERIDLWGHTVTFIAPSVYGPGEAWIRLMDDNAPHTRSDLQMAVWKRIVRQMTRLVRLGCEGESVEIERSECS
ncbi:O-acyltransferase WSD1 [Triticum urartu]|uniref:O-acyltransferase WSD1 n=1 Tax=Triticum urartu TaxID=4572 RepID=M7ZRZ4_TRIUA|nr:O-acyltransferase WSD1 [Triticum urartu]